MPVRVRITKDGVVQEQVTTDSPTSGTVFDLPLTLGTEVSTTETITNLTAVTASFSGPVAFTGPVTGITSSTENLIVGVDGDTAAAGSSASDATVLSSGKTMYHVASDTDTKGVKLNASDATAGKLIYIINDSAKKCKIYPNTGATIDGTTSYTVDSGKVVSAGYYATNKWFVLKSA